VADVRKQMGAARPWTRFDWNQALNILGTDRSDRLEKAGVLRAGADQEVVSDLGEEIRGRSAASFPKARRQPHRLRQGRSQAQHVSYEQAEKTIEAGANNINPIEQQSSWPCRE